MSYTCLHNGRKERKPSPGFHSERSAAGNFLQLFTRAGVPRLSPVYNQRKNFLKHPPETTRWVIEEKQPSAVSEETRGTWAPVTQKGGHFMP